MEFDEELGAHTDRAEESASKHLIDSYAALAEHVSTTLEDPEKTLDFDGEAQAGGDILAALNLLDAVALLREDFFDDEDATYNSIRVRPELTSMQSALRDGFANGDFENRSCVYVAWSGRPRVFHYVGKAVAASTRLVLASHGKLANALASANWLTLVYPATDSERAVLELEASIIEVYWGATGKLPDLNERRGNVPMRSEEWDQVKALSRYFTRLGKCLSI